ncbi:MAG: GAF domain-containing protein [Acidobacteriaceae bacterium]|nr:GAF domain-containing protein [Acidobacteriaceae bacterium]
MSLELLLEKELPQDLFEAFLSVPIISQNKVVGVINVQHREAHIHSGSDMEMLSTVGEQVGCLLVLSQQKSVGTSTAPATV